MFPCCFYVTMGNACHVSDVFMLYLCSCESKLDVENTEKFYGEEISIPIIVVRGPPGTEPVMVNNTPFKGRYDDNESVVYSRISSSSGAGLSNGHTPSPSQVLSIPSKDIPKLRAEVYATPTRSRRVLR